MTTYSALAHIQRVSAEAWYREEWLRLIRSVQKPALLINATGISEAAGCPAILPKGLAPGNIGYDAGLPLCGEVLATTWTMLLEGKARRESGGGG